MPEFHYLNWAQIREALAKRCQGHIEVSELLKITVKTGSELNAGHTELPIHPHAQQHRLWAADGGHGLKPQPQNAWALPGTHILLGGGRVSLDLWPGGFFPSVSPEAPADIAILFSEALRPL